MTLIDTHTHLYLPEFDHDRSNVVENALAAGVEKMFLPNIDRDTVKPLLALAAQFPLHCYPMAGLHPTSVKENWKEEMAFVEKTLEENSFIAVGEIGIDLYWDKTFEREQQEVFARQIQLALDHRLPVVIHSRESLPVIFDVLRGFSRLPGGVFHSFTGTRSQAEMILEMGFGLGIGGIVTFRNSSLKEELKPLGPGAMVLETDAPFLAPVPRRGKRNESKYLIYIARFLAGLFDITPEEIARITTANARKIFPAAFAGPDI
jgi:TatD DNase family protein